MKTWLKARLAALSANGTLKVVAGTTAAVGAALVAPEAMAAPDVANITAFATDAYTSAILVVDEYGKVFMLPIALISVLWILGKRFLWRSV
jgi:hypothetical protein